MFAMHHRRLVNTYTELEVILHVLINAEFFIVN